MFKGKKPRGTGMPLPPSVKFTQTRNDAETKKLNKSVDKYQKELEKRIRDLSTNQNKLLSARRRDSRGGPFLATNSLNPTKDARRNGGNSSEVVRASAQDRRALSIKGNSAKFSVGIDKDLSAKSIAKSSKPVLPRLIIPNIQLPKEDPSPQATQSTQSPKLPTSPPETTPKKNAAMLKWRQIAKDVSRTQIPAKPDLLGTPDLRFKRRGSGTFGADMGAVASQLSMNVSENSLLVPRHRRRRGSCPAVTWSGGDLFREIRQAEEARKQKEWEKQMEDLKGCRYLRLPNSINEQEEDKVEEEEEAKNAWSAKRETTRRRTWGTRHD